MRAANIATCTIKPNRSVIITNYGSKIVDSEMITARINPIRRDDKCPNVFFFFVGTPIKLHPRAAVSVDGPVIYRGVKGKIALPAVVGCFYQPVLVTKR